MNNYHVRSESISRKATIHSPEKSFQKEELCEVNQKILKATNHNKANNNNPTASKDKLLLLSESLIDSEIDFTKILKSSYEFHILNSAFIEESLSNYITFASLSISNQDQGNHY